MKAEILAVALIASLAPAYGQVTETEVGCNESGARCREFSAAFEFPATGIAGSILLSFEEATSLRPDSLVVSAEMVDPRSNMLRARMPRDTYIPAGFPVLVRIETKAGGDLSFRRNWTLELVTDNLEYSSHTPYRLFRAPNGGAFEDISFSLGSGSLRVRGIGASFSEFVIAADLRPVDRIVGQKIARLELLLSANAGELGSVLDDLQQFVAQTRQALGDGNLPLAIASMDAFHTFVENASGTQIDDDSRPGDGHESLAARLLTSGLTLRHTLFLGLESAQGGMSGFSRRLKVGGDNLEILLEFDEAFVVRPEDLEIEAEVVDPHDPVLLARLPSGVQVPEEFPVLIHINPKAGVDQAFSGRYEVEIQTDGLRFVGGTPLRLFKAPDGGAFEDITRTYGLGSLRVRGIGASFSDFLIAEDMRPVETVIADKFESLADVFEANADDIPRALRTQLEQAVSQVRMNVEQGLIAEAITGIEGVVEGIEAAAGEGIPALWRSEEALTNVAGELIALLESLVFSLEIRDASTLADPGDVNRDGEVNVGDIFFLINQVFGDSPPPAELFFPAKSDEQRQQNPE